MIGWSLQGGDVVVYNNDIQLVNDGDEIRQNAQYNINTNIGEWWLDTTMGIDFKAILRKDWDIDRIKAEIAKGLSQCDPTFVIDEFSYKLNQATREMRIDFSASNEAGRLEFSEVFTM